MSSRSSFAHFFNAAAAVSNTSPSPRLVATLRNVRALGRDCNALTDAALASPAMGHLSVRLPMRRKPTRSTADARRDLDPKAITVELVEQLPVWYRCGLPDFDLNLDVWERLARDDRKMVRWEVAKSCHTPVDILARLAVDRYPTVRQAVAENPVTLLRSLR